MYLLGNKLFVEPPPEFGHFDSEYLTEPPVLRQSSAALFNEAQLSVISIKWHRFEEGPLFSAICDQISRLTGLFLHECRICDKPSSPPSSTSDDQQPPSSDSWFFLPTAASPPPFPAPPPPPGAFQPSDAPAPPPPGGGGGGGGVQTPHRPLTDGFRPPVSPTPIRTASSLPPRSASSPAISQACRSPSPQLSPQPMLSLSASSLHSSSLQRLLHEISGSSLRSLTLASCRLSAAALLELLLVLPAQLTELNVSGNEQNDEFIVKTAELLLRRPQLQTLVLGESTGRYGLEAMTVLLQVIQRSNTTVLVVEVSWASVTGTIDELEAARAQLKRLLARNGALDAALNKGKKTLDLRERIGSIDELELVPWDRLERCSSVDLRDNACITQLPTVLHKLHPSVRQIELSPGYMSGLDATMAANYTAAALIEYLRCMQTSQMISFPETRLMVMGRAAVGKTTLLRRLREESFLPALLSTDGVDLGTLSIDEFLFVTYDFGGQQVYRYTHQIFLSGAAVFLLLFSLVDPPGDSVSELSFWLQSIVSRVDSVHQAAAFLLVGTHADRLSSRVEQMAILGSVEQGLRKKFPGQEFAASLLVDATDPQRSWVRRLRDQLVVTARAVTPKVPASVTQARLVVERLARRHYPPVVPTAELSEHIRQHFVQAGISWSSGIYNAVLKALQLLGSIVVVRGASDSSCAVLSTQWVAALFASIVTTRHSYVQSNRGLLLREHLPHIWIDQARFPPALHDTMLDILQQFDIIFPLDLQHSGPTTRWLVSCLLPAKLPEDNDFCFLGVGVIERLFVFERPCPAGLMPRIVGHMSSTTSVRCAAQNGCTGDVDGLHFELLLRRMDTVRLRIVNDQPTMQGLTASSRLLDTMMSLMRNLLIDYFNIKFRVQIPCCSRCHFAMDQLRQRLAAGHESAVCSCGQHVLPMMYIAPDIISTAQLCAATPWSDVELDEELGRGAFGTVWRGRWRSGEGVGPRPVAVKILSGVDTTPAAIEEFQHEIGIMTRCRHPNIVALLGLAVRPLAMIMQLLPARDLYKQLHDPLQLNTIFDVVEQLLKATSNRTPDFDADQLLLDYSQQLGALFDRWIAACPPSRDAAARQCRAETLAAVEQFVRAPSRDTDDELLRCQARTQTELLNDLDAVAPIELAVRFKVARQVAAALRFLHSQSPPIIHRDVKTPNILLHRSLSGLRYDDSDDVDEPLALLGDLGLSVQLPGVRHLRGGQGTAVHEINPTWAAPELIDGFAYSLPSDVYGFALVLWELFARRVPFAGVSSMFLARQVCDGQRPPIDPDRLPHRLAALIQRCWSSSAADRPSIDQVCDQLDAIGAELFGGAPAPAFATAATAASHDGLRPGRQGPAHFDLVGQMTIAPPRWLLEASQAVPPSQSPAAAHAGLSTSDASVSTMGKLRSRLSSRRTRSESMEPYLTHASTTMRVRSMCIALGCYLWIGFRNGCHACVPVSEAEQLAPAITYASQPDHVEQAIDALAYTSAHYGQVWSGGSGGLLRVFAATPKTGQDAVEHAQCRGYVEQCRMKMWTRRWLTLDGGVLRLYKGRIVGKEVLALPLLGRIAELSPELQELPGGELRLRIGPLLLRQSSNEHSASLELIVQQCLQCLRASADQPQLCLLGSINVKAAIVALRAVDNDVWSASSDLVLCQWELQLDDATGLRPDRHLLTPKRAVLLHQATAAIEPRFRCFSGFVALPAASDRLWCLLGNQLLPVDRGQAALPSYAATAEPTGHQQIIIAAAVVQLPHDEAEIWTADNSGLVCIWKVHASRPNPQLNARIQVEEPVMSLHAVTSANQMCFGLASSRFVRYDISTRMPVDDDDRQPHFEAVSAIVSLTEGNSCTIYAGSWDGSVSIWKKNEK